MDDYPELSARGGRSNPIAVSELVRFVRGVLNENIGEYWVSGEISNARLAASNHFYFTLKDDRGAINAVMFRSAFSRLRFKPEDGIEVIVRGRVSIFEARGQLQLYAEEMDPRGAGALALAFEQLKKRLAAEGLFDEARKRALPFMPRTVGIVTARGGAALHDMLRLLRDRFPNLHVILRPAKVQGDGAAREIADAIADLNRDGRAEVMIVGRGGGSLEDLWAFNEEIVARAIYNSEIPVISAVGHEVDYTIADFVADLRAPTPTAAAQIAVPSKAELRERSSAAGAALLAAIERHLIGLRETVDDVAARIRAPAAILREIRIRTGALANALVTGTQRTVERQRSAMAELAARLDVLSPLKVLERGYAVAVNLRDGRALRDATDAEIGDELDIRLARGALLARTLERRS
ncbi:MAG TPA: exodeoxyribonuclease VII large subunit [Candidatus Binataceae bacterium]|nr:exodeoxyribonuclease VII large subunit [Candidatus Binataceae bacterium]